MLRFGRPVPLILLALAACLSLAGLSPGRAASAPGKSRAAIPGVGAPRKAPVRWDGWVYPPGPTPLVAQVDRRPITVAMVEQRFLRLQTVSPMEPDSAGFQSLMQGLIQKALVSYALEDHGYRLTPEEKLIFARDRDKTLRNYFYTLYVGERSKVSEARIQELYQMQHHSWAAHRLAVERKSLADSLAVLLRGGAGFEAVAAAQNVDPDTRNSYGLVQQIWTPGFTPVATESALVALRPGGVSAPYQVAGQGPWFVVKLDSIVTQDPGPIPENRGKLEEVLSTIRRAQVRDSISQVFYRTAQAAPVEATIALVAQYYDTMLTRRSLADTANNGLINLDLTGPIPVFSEAEARMALAHSKYGDVTVADLVKDIKDTPKPLRPRFKSPEAIGQYAMVLASAPAITEQARLHGVDTLSFVVRDLQDLEESVLGDRMYRDLVSSRVAPTEDSLKAYYRAHKDWFDAPESGKYQVIDVSDSALADSLWRQVMIGADMGRLATDFAESIIYNTHKGVTDWIYRGSQRDTSWESHLFSLYPDRTFEKPWEHEGVWYLVRCLGRTDRHSREFSEVRDDVKKFWVNTREEVLFQALLRESAKRHPVKLHPEGARQVRLGRAPRTDEM